MKMRVDVVILSALLAFCSTSLATQVYQNTFDNEDSLEGFTSHRQINPLETVSIESGQLRIETDYLGTVGLSLNTSSFEEPYNTTLSQNSGIVSWSFNISNENYQYNNSFSFVLANTAENPFDISGHGYCFKGGGMVGDRMGLWRFDYGTGGGQQVLIDISDGLGVLPEKGSFRITYNPVDDMWSLFGDVGAVYVDPEQVTNFLGSAVEGTYTSVDTSYMSLMSGTTGNTYFDNVTVSVIPEPCTLSLLALGASFLAGRKRRV
jgi:hypothetical protein